MLERNRNAMAHKKTLEEILKEKLIEEGINKEWLEEHLEVIDTTNEE